MERGYLLPTGCKDLIDVFDLHGKLEMLPWGIRLRRTNEMIIASQVKVIGLAGEQLGIMERGEALKLARALRVELVEISPKAEPPICKLIDYAKLAREM